MRSAEKELTLQQVSDATYLSDEQISTLVCDPTSFKVTQQFPISRPDWSLGYLWLASRRAGVSITIRNSEAAPFRLIGLECAKAETDREAGQPVALTVGPSHATPQKTASLRARMTFDPDKSELSIEAFKITSDDTGKPLLFQFSRKEEAGVADCTFRLVDSELSVGDIKAFLEATSAHKKGDLRTAITIAGRPLISIDALNIVGINAGFDDELVQKLAILDQAIPYPFYLEQQYADRLTSCNIASIRNEFDSIIAQRERHRPTLTSLFLRFSTVELQDYYEEFLGLYPPNFGFNAPTVHADGISQAEIDEEWKSGGKKLEFESNFREDLYELAKELREWSEDPSKPFPFRYDENIKCHYSKTRMSITFDRVIDRQWYLERRVTIRLRPNSKSERYSLEMDYWKAQGDDRRAALLGELFQRAATAGAAQPHMRVSDEADEAAED